MTSNMWGLYRVCESGDAHSGYEFPWSPFRLIPFSGISFLHFSPFFLSQLSPHSQQGQFRYFLRYLGHDLWNQQELLLLFRKAEQSGETQLIFS